MSDPKDINIILNTGTILRFFTIGILLYALYFVSDVVLVIVSAVVIASAIEPIIRRLNRNGVRRVIGVVFIYVVIAVILIAVLVFLMPLVVDDAVKFLSSLPKSISIESLWSPISSISGYTNSSNTLSQHFISVSDLISDLKLFIVGTGTSALGFISVIFGGIFSFILIMVLSFYLAVQTDGVGDFLRIVAPVKHHDYITDLWKRSQRKIALWLQGQVILGIVVGILVFIVLKIVGIPYALILAVFAGLFEIIPVFGPIFSSIPPILLAFTEKGFGTGILLLVLYFIIYQFESQVFYPMVVKKIVGISPILVIIALVVGAKLAGVLGALISVPIAAAFMEYINDIEKYKKAEIAEKAITKKLDF